MEKLTSVYYNGVPVGNVLIKYKDNKLSLSARCWGIGDGVFRAFLRSSKKTEFRLLIGVMMPDVSGEMKAKRTYTRNDLLDVKFNFEDIDSGELVLYEKLGDSKKITWYECEEAKKFFSDAALKNSIRSSDKILVDSVNVPKRFAAPLSKHAPFAFAPAFCLVQVIKINGITYGILRVSDCGVPEKVNILDINGT